MDHHRRRRDSYDSDPETNNNESSSSMSKSELSRQIDKLNRDLQRRDRELEDERQENLRVLERIKKLEKDKVELRREVDDFRDEANEYKKSLEELKSKRKPGEEVAKEKYEVSLQQKNHEIRQLLDDIEKLEGEKSSLQSKLNELKESLQDATQQLESMTQEHVGIKMRLQKSEAKIKELQDDKVILEIKLKDLLSFKQRHDQYLENLCSAVDVRVDVWKKMMFQKDEEIDRLNVKLATLANQIPTGHGHVENDKTVVQLKAKLLEREATITTLNEKLALATQDLNSATEHINSLNAKLKFAEHPDKSEAAIETLEFKVNRYKSQLDRKDEQIGQLEKEVEEKSRELTSLSARMHGYETGIYGLSEAISEIKELKTQLRIRNNQIENQTQELNILNLKFNDIVDENDMLRDKLGIESLDIQQDTHNFTASRQKQLMDLKSQISSLEEEIVQLKSQNYSYRKQLLRYETNTNTHTNAHTNISTHTNAHSNISTHTNNHTHTNVHTNAHVNNHSHAHTNNHTNTPVSNNTHHPVATTKVPSPPPRHTPTPPVPQVQVDDFGKNLAANFDETDWKDRYEIVLGENVELRKGLQEILETMQQMADEGTSDVLIQCPILENLLREMSARGLIHYPYGISSFHLKVCNLEGKNAQLREEIHRLKLEEKQNRADLINTSATIQSLKDKLVTATASIEVTGPSSSDGMVLSLQTEIESLHSQIRHLKDVLQFETTVDNLDQCVQTVPVPRSEVFSQTDKIEEKNYERLEMETKRLTAEVEALTRKVTDQAIVIDAKDKVIEDFRLINFSYPHQDNKSHSDVGQIKELEEALNISRETATSLQDRLKAKEENLNQYRSLLAEIRSEMTAATNRHVQEMRALQLTIYQQQQAFTRMKSTLSQPVKDTLNIEGTIKDQLTRIHELEDEVSELQHTLGNVASQLTTARSEAHRWRCTADARLKELDVARESQKSEKIEEVSLLREKLKHQELKLTDLEAENMRLRSAKDSITDIVNVIRNEHQQVTSGLQKSSFKELNDRLVSKDKEIEELQTANKQLQSKISALQVRVSKMNAVSKHLGHSVEMEQLKSKYVAAEEEKLKLETELRNLNKNRDVEDEKKRKATESMARWEEAKKWKKTVEKLETQIDTLKKDNEKLAQANKNLRASIARLDKMVLDCKKLQPPTKSILKQADDSIEIDKLKFEIQDLNELVEKTEFEGREKAATLEMEIRCLKERIVTQERQLAAYQIAQKGDPKLVSEIEKMAGKEEELHKTINSLEEDNLHLKLQMEQLRLDTPRLRDRVQQLQRLVEVLKSEKPETVSTRANSQKSLSELERTITALKQLIEKIQSENKRLRNKPANKTMSSASSENLRVTLESLVAEKKSLMDQLALLEEEKKKYQKLYIESSSNLESLEIRFQDAERRAKSSEMKLRTFLGEDSDEHSVYQRVKSLEVALDRKTKLLDDAKLALRQAAGSK